MLYSLDDIRRHLQPGFSEKQTDLLATCLYEYYQPIVHQREMAALRGVMGEVAEAQKRTETRVEELAEAQTRTEARVEELAEAQQRTEMRMEELAVAQKRTEVRMGELAEAQKRTESRMEELAEAEARTEARIDRLTAAQEETRAEIDELVQVTKTLVWGQDDLRKQLGGIALSVGQGLEAYAMERVPTLLEQEFGFKTRSAMPEVLGPPGASFEIDVVYRGSHAGQPVVVLTEVKTNITETEVREFLALVDRVRPAAGTPDVRVLFFGYRAADAARRLIAEHGCLLAFPRGLVVA